jgi:glycosyltransferase involved in cell wall biosynthesis
MIIFNLFVFYQLPILIIFVFMSSSVSVITICFNNLSALQQTCLSVDKQTMLPGEHIIIDGSSNKKIFHWLENNKQPNYRKWLHERDNGISDAFNKGILKSSSPITHLLNAGDEYYVPDAIAFVKECFENNAELKWTHSKYVQHRGETDVISGATFEKSKLWKGMRTVAHPTMFIKRELYDKYGLYNANYKIAMDYDFLVRIRDENFAFIPRPLVYFAPGGASIIHFNKGLAEVRRSYYRNIGKSSKLILWQLRQQVLNLFMQSDFGKVWFQAKNKKAIVRSNN